MPLNYARRQAKTARASVRGWLAIQDRRLQPRARFCSDTRATQYSLAIVGGTIAILMLGGQFGVIELHGVMEMFIERNIGILVATPGIMLSLAHLWCLRYARGCNWACFVCCLGHSFFWGFNFIFSLLIGMFGFNVVYGEIALMALWAAGCLSRRLEDDECAGGGDVE